MEITIILQWLAAWGLLLLAQSIFINGVYQSATGETKKRVDGSDEDSEMILYPLKKFFNKLTNKYIVYKGLEFEKLIYAIVADGNMAYLLKMRFTSDAFFPVADGDEKWLNIAIPIIEAKHSVMIRSALGKYQFIKEYEDYKYTKWLRKPIIQCIKCMSSFWGALTFWPVVLFLFGFNWLEIPVFFADMFSLTYLNWVLYLKAQK
jgi:hypothetical protein